MPRELKQIGQNIGCEPIKNFYDRDGSVEPDYLNAHDGRDVLDSRWRASFWCKAKKKANEYWLVFAVDGQLAYEQGCKPILVWKTKPLGLAIHSQKIPINLMHEISNGKKALWKLCKTQPTAEC